MNGDTMLLATSAAGAAALVAAYSFVTEWLFRNRSRIDERLKDEFNYDGRRRDGGQSLFKSLSEQSADAQESLAARFQLFVEQSGVPLSPARVLEIAGAAGVVTGTATALFSPHWLLAVPAAAVAFAAPFLFLQIRRRQRIERLSNQLPEAFELMSRVVRAGQTMPAAFKMVAHESKPPLADEFSHCCEQQDLGLPQEVTLREMARRNGVMELEMFVVALLVQRQTGGSPVELLTNLSQLVRKRIRMRGKVKALTSEGRLQALVLSILPLVAFAAIYALKPSYAQVLLDRPMVLVATVMSAATGSLWIRKIVNFDF